MLAGILIITVLGFLAGEVAGKLRLPKLIGMLLLGIMIGPYALNFIPQDFLAFSEEIRLLALLIILFKAGLLTMGVPNGEYILAISVLSILTTAPLGAFAISFFAPRWLTKGEVDPTKITVKDEYRFLVAMDGSPLAHEALREATRMARQVDAELIVLNVRFNKDDRLSEERIEQELTIARDLDHEIIITEGNPAESIIETAERHNVDYIFMGKRGQQNHLEKLLLGDMTEIVIRNSEIPVILIEENGNVDKKMRPVD